MIRHEIFQGLADMMYAKNTRRNVHALLFPTDLYFYWFEFGGLFVSVMIAWHDGAHRSVNLSAKFSMIFVK